MRTPARAALAACAAALTVVAGCGGSDASTTSAQSESDRSRSGPPTTIKISAVPPEHRRGARVFSEQGCLGCHMIAGRGDDLGPDLTDVGARIPPAAIARSIEVGPSIMPSYRDLRKKVPDAFDDLVGFLASLKADPMPVP